MQSKNYVAVLFGIVALAALVASGCTPGIPTGNYEERDGEPAVANGFILSLKTTGPVITGTITFPPAYECDDIVMNVLGENTGFSNWMCTGQGEMTLPDGSVVWSPCCTGVGEGICPPPIQMLATFNAGESCWWEQPRCYALEHASAAMDGSNLVGVRLECDAEGNPTGAPVPVELAKIVP